MVGLCDRRTEGRFELRLVREPLAHVRRRAVENYHERHVVLDRVVRRLGLGQQVPGQKLVDRPGTGFRRDRLVALRLRPLPLLGFGRLGTLGLLPLDFGADQAVRRPGDPENQGHEHQTGRKRRGLVSLDELAEAIPRRWRPCVNRLIVEIALDIAGEAVRGFVAAIAVLLHRLHDDPVQLAADQLGQLRRFGLPQCRDRRRRSFESDSRVLGRGGSSSRMIRRISS